MIEFKDLKTQYLINKEKFDEAIQNVLNSAQFIGGPEVKRLENRLAEYIGVKHCITCGNGTDALYLVLLAWGIKEGDAVFVPDFTFFATAEAVSLLGATPIFVDVFEDTFNIDTNKLEEAIIKTLNENKLTPKAIIPVDLFGLPANYPKIDEIARRHNLKVLEDGAQGFGGSINGKKACSFGDAATTSFFPAKPLGCFGDGGAIFTNDDELSNLIRSLAVHGKGEHKYDNIRIGVNSRLDAIQAAILNVKLDLFIDFELRRLNEIAETYNHGLKNIIDIPLVYKDYKSCWAQYTIKLKDRDERDRLKETLNNHNIPSIIYYSKSLSMQKPYNKVMNNTISKSLNNIVLSIPIHPYLTALEIDKIINIIKNFVVNKAN